MYIRETTLDDLDTVMSIYGDAREYMRQNGNAEQWAGGYPQKEIIVSDINSGKSYVCIDGDDIVGVFYHAFESDPTYEVIYDGQWLNPDRYGVIHRIAVASHRRGVASFCFEWCFERCPNLKIDTHRDNIPMQKSLAKNRFEYCGIIHLSNGDERLAYQRTAKADTYM